MFTFHKIPIEFEKKKRVQSIFNKPYFRTKVMESCVSIQGIRLWNDLQPQIKEDKSINIFVK